MDYSKAPNTIPWPPLIGGMAIIMSVVLGRLMPLDVAIPMWVRGAGAMVLLAGLGLDVAAITTMRRQNANISPHRSATALVSSGPFALSRNPIYLGNTVMLAGAGLVFGNLWFVLLSALGAQALATLAIRREEAHMAALFGQKWAAYAARVPRWIGPIN